MPTEDDNRAPKDEAVATHVDPAPDYALAGALPAWDLVPEAPLVRRR
jgi:hypothetical protein